MENEKEEKQPNGDSKNKEIPLGIGVSSCASCGEDEEKLDSVSLQNSNENISNNEKGDIANVVLNESSKDEINESKKIAEASSVSITTSTNSSSTTVVENLINGSAEILPKNFNKIKIKLKKPDLNVIDYEICLGDLVKELKQKLSEVVSLPPENQRLINFGRVFEDNKRLEFYNIKENQTIFVLNNSPRIPAASTCASNVTSSSSFSSTSFAATSSSAFSNSSLSSIFSENNLFPYFLSSSNAASSSQNSYSALGLNSFATNLASTSTSTMQNDDFLNGMFNNSLMLNLIENPNFISTLLESNPQLNRLRERNPELNHMLNDPQMLRQSMELMRNPSLMREMMRSSDRAMNNIEAIPGGFNALRRMYHSIQEPMWSATVEGNPLNSNSPQEVSQNFDLQTNLPPNTQAMPNPWAPNSGLNTSSSFSTNEQPYSNVAALPQVGLRGRENEGLNSSLSFLFSGSSYPSNTSNERENSAINFPEIMRAMRNMNLNNDVTQSIQNLSVDNFHEAQNPEMLYQTQLNALRNMGFTDTQACIEALRESNGNINRAIDRLLGESNNP